MQIHSNNHIYEAVPPFLNNREQTADQMIWFGMQSISQPEADKLEQATIAAYNDLAKDKAGEKVSELNLTLIKSKVKSINNLFIDGEPVTDFDEFYRRAPKEMVSWVCNAIQSSIALSLAERKNFLPESGSPS